MKKNNICIYKPNSKTKFRRSLAKEKNQTYTEVESTTVASSCLVRLSTTFFTPYTRFYPRFLTFPSFVTSFFAT